MDAHFIGKLRKSIIGIIFAGALIAIIVPAISTNAYAGNHQDTWYSSYCAPHNVSCTDARDKLDDTSSWNNCRGGANHTVEIAATPSYWDVKFIGSPIYPWWNGRKGYLINYVRESGYSRALLWFNNRSNYATTISGLWSPDSI